MRRPPGAISAARLAEVVLGGRLRLARGLEAARVPQRRLLLVVPADLAATAGERIHEQARGEDGVGVGRARHGDAVLGLDAHDLGDGHPSPYPGAVTRIVRPVAGSALQVLSGVALPDGAAEVL